MANVGDLTVTMRVNASAFIAEMEKSRIASERLGRTVESMSARANRALEAMNRAVGALGVSLSVGALVQLGRSSIATVGALGDLAAQLGISAEALQVFRYAALTGGASTEQLETGLIRLGDLVGNAARGNREAIETLNGLRVSILDVTGAERPLAAIFEDVARAITAIESPTRQTASANDVFGRTGARLIPMLADLAGGYDQMRAAAERAGQVVSTDMVDRTKRLADSWAAIGSRLTNIAAIVATPAFERFAQVLQWADRGIQMVDIIINGGSISEIQQLTERITGLRNNLEFAQSVLAGLMNRPADERENLFSAIERRREEVRGLEEEIATAEARLNQLRPRPPAGASNPPASGTPPRASGVAARATEADRFGESLERLQRQLDPVYRMEREYAEQRALLDQAFNTGAFSVQTYAERVTQLNTRFGEAQKSALGVADGAARATDRTGELIQAFEGFGRSSAKTIADMVVGLDQANFSIGRLIQTLASGILEKLIYERITGPLTRAAGGFLDNLLGSAFSLFGGKSAAFAGVPAGVTAVSVGHGGGVGRELGRSRVVDAMAFAGAPRFHAGKAPWGTGEMPAIIRPDEGVFTPGQMRALGPRGDVSIEIIDQRGAGAPPVKTEHGTGPDGRRLIRMTIQSETRTGIEQGAFDRSLASNFGVARTPARR